MLTERFLADDLVADWRAVAVAVERPEAGSAPVSPTDGSAAHRGTCSDDPACESPAARIAADTAVPNEPGAQSRCPATINLLRATDPVREPDPVMSPSARPGTAQQTFALSAQERAGGPEAPTQDVLSLDADDIAPAFRTVEPGWDPFPEPGPRTGDVSASGISFAVPPDGVQVRKDRDSDFGRPAKRPQAKTLLEALLLIEAKAVQERALATIGVLPFAVEQRPNVSIERNSPLVEFGPVHARLEIFSGGWTIHSTQGEILATADRTEDIAGVLIGEYVAEIAETNRIYLGLMHPKVQMLNRWETDSAPVKKMLATFRQRMEQLREQHPNEPDRVLAIVLQEMLASELVKRPASAPDDTT